MLNINSRPTPFYLYDIDLLRSTLQQLQAETHDMPYLTVHYAIKANADSRVLADIRRAGLGADCVSGGEIHTALAAKFPADSIVFAGVGKSDTEIMLALEAGIYCFNVESAAELQVISQLAEQSGRTARICLRVNPQVEAHTHTGITTGRAEDKFGIDLDDLPSVCELAASLPGINFAGLHFHIGSQINDMADFVDLAKRVNEIQAQFEAHGITLHDINVGGGLGIDYDNPNEHPIPRLHDYFNVWRKHLKLRPGQRLHVELGRSIVGQCGSLITRVLYVKESRHKRFIITDAGMTELMRPALYGAHHKIENITVQQNLRLTDWIFPATNYATYDIVGPICESSDVFLTDANFPVTKRGDLLAIRSAGAYGYVMSTAYNGRPHIENYTIEQLTESVNN